MGGGCQIAEALEAAKQELERSQEELVLAQNNAATLASDLATAKAEAAEVAVTHDYKRDVLVLVISV